MEFDKYAKEWDTEKRIDRAKIIAKEISKALEHKSTDSALEFGCGTGLISLNLHDQFRKITLLDLSAGMIDILNSKINQHGIKNVISVQGDVFDHNIIHETFDVIYNSMILHHISDIEAIADRFYELLNNVGTLCIVDLDEEDGSFHQDFSDFNGHNGFNQEELKNILMGAGFVDIESKTFYHDDRVIDGKKIEYSLFLLKAKKGKTKALYPHQI